MIIGLTLGVTISLWQRFDGEAEKDLDLAFDRGLASVQSSLEGLDTKLLQLLEADVLALRLSEDVSPDKGLNLLAKMDEAFPTTNRVIVYFETLYSLSEVDDYLSRMSRHRQ